MNMFCGYASIVYSHQNQFVIAGWLIIIAAVFDTIDGFAARMTNSMSEFGVELDSLSDLVSFGAAPSFLVYQYGLESYGLAGLLMSSLLMIGSGLRLARFNVQLTGFIKDKFSGLPTPSQAMTVATFVMWTAEEKFLTTEQTQTGLIWLSIGLAALMVSKVTYETLPKPTASEFKKYPVKMAVYTIAFLLILIFQAKAFFLAMMAFIIFGLVRATVSLFLIKDEPIATEPIPIPNDSSLEN
jgi:CDP-diacylglycerol--serine O-phosphatidyltransferase